MRSIRPFATASTCHTSASENNVATEGLAELVNPHVCFAFLAVDHFHRCHVRVKRFPLTRPLGANLFFRLHDRLPIESRTGFSDEHLCVCHWFSCVYIFYATCCPRARNSRPQRLSIG